MGILQVKHSVCCSAQTAWQHACSSFTQVQAYGGNQAKAVGHTMSVCIAKTQQQRLLCATTLYICQWATFSKPGRAHDIAASNAYCRAVCPTVYSKLPRLYSTWQGHLTYSLVLQNELDGWGKALESFACVMRGPWLDCCNQSSELPGVL